MGREKHQSPHVVWQLRERYPSPVTNRKRETRVEKQQTLDSGKLKEFHSHGFRVPWMEVNSEERGPKGFQGVGNS